MRCFAAPIVACTLLFSATPAAPLQAALPPPVDAAIADASQRFGVSTAWIEAVIAVESGGNPMALSRAGAIGLMQVMPSTYAALRLRYGLGADPFHIADNVHAGTAYLRLLYDRYGTRGMLAAYNAGPGRWEQHLASGRPLPAETLLYLARLQPRIGLAPQAVPLIGNWHVAAVQPSGSVFVRVTTIAETREGPSRAPGALSDAQGSAGSLRPVMPIVQRAAAPSAALFVRRSTSDPAQ